jgi:Bacterial Ig domain
MKTGPQALCVNLALVMFAGCARTPPLPTRFNELPFGFIDTPTNGKMVGRMVEVGGWAVDDTGVAGIRIYVDGKLEGVTNLSVQRPDVSKALPKYVHGSSDASNRHGWRAAVDLGEQAGRHTILVQAFDDEGASRDVGSVVVSLIGRQ